MAAVSSDLFLPIPPIESLLKGPSYGPSSMFGITPPSHSNNKDSSSVPAPGLFDGVSAPAVPTLNVSSPTPSPSLSLTPSPYSVPSLSLHTTGEHMMGTTIMAVSFNGGVVMGADSRTSTGIYVANRVSDKISPVHDLIYCCRSGSAADTQAVSDIVKYYLSAHSIELGERPLVRTAAHLFQELCYQNKDRLLAGIIIGGYDDKDGGSVYALPLGGTLVKQNFAIGGSGSTYIYGFVDAHYRVGMSKEECLKFVRTAVSHAMARDGSSGGVVRTVVISKDGIEKEMTPGNKLPYLPEQHLE